VASGVSITLPVQGDMTAPPGKTFGGWSVDGQAYAAGASYAVTANVTFTAQWLGVASISAVYDGQTDYGICEPFDLSHLVVTAQFDNGTSGVIDVTEANLAGWDNTAAGAKTITVTAGSITTSQPINVTVKTLAERIAAAVQESTATITLYTDESLEPTSLSASSSATITLQGAGAERTIQIGSGSGSGPLFTLGARVTLVLDSNITLQGKAGNTGNGLVYVNASTAALTMKAGSKITGNTSSGNAGGVYLYTGSFTMEGGTIVGNTSNGPAGGVYAHYGSFVMTGGTITGNISNSAINGTGGLYIGTSNIYTATISGGTINGNTGLRYGDVAIANDRTLILSGAPLIGSITLAAASGAYPKISVSAALTGSPYPVDLAVVNSASVEAVKSLWAVLTPAERTIISRSTNPAYTPTGDDIGKFTLRNFVHNATDGNSQAVSTAYSGASIGTDGIVTLGGGGTVSGTVSLEDSGSGVSGATVVLKKGGDTVGSTNPDSGGDYSFASLELSGGYTVEASFAGYADAVSAAFAVTGAGATAPPLTLFPPTVTLHNGGSVVVGDYTVLAALRWIAANAAANGNYTITLTANDTLEPYTLDPAAVNNKTGVTITLKGDTQERTLQIGAANGPLFTLSSQVSVTLVLDNNITLEGKAGNTGNGLVLLASSVAALTMKAGSKITGNTSSGNAGGVYIQYGRFTMEGGTITGNTSTSTASYTYASGGISLSSSATDNTLTISGGNITGNTGCYGDVAVAISRTFNLSGNPTIGGITLVVNTTATTSKIVVTGELSSSSIPIDLALSNSASLDAVKTAWASLASPQIIFGSTSPAYTLTSSDIGKFTLRNFVHRVSANETIDTTYSSAAINNNGELVLGETTP
jgi:hypothetical protein